MIDTGVWCILIDTGECYLLTDTGGWCLLIDTDV